MQQPKVRDVMQADVVTIDAGGHLDVADKLMRADRIRHLPVVSAGRLVGVLSQRDVFHAGPSSALHLDPRTELARLKRIAVADVMATEVFTTHPDASLASAVEMMLLKDVGCLPVVEDEELVGLLSVTDCLRYLAQLLERSP